MMVMGFSLFDRDSLQIRAKCRAAQSDDQRGLSEAESGLFNLSRPRYLNVKSAYHVSEVLGLSCVWVACELGLPDDASEHEDQGWTASRIVSLRGHEAQNIDQFEHQMIQTNDLRGSAPQK